MKRGGPRSYGPYPRNAAKCDANVRYVACEVVPAKARKIRVLIAPVLMAHSLQQARVLTSSGRSPPLERLRGIRRGECKIIDSVSGELLAAEPTTRDARRSLSPRPDRDALAVRKRDSNG